MTPAAAKGTTDEVAARSGQTTWMLGGLVSSLSNGPYGASYGLLWGLLSGLTKSTDHPSITEVYCKIVD